MSNNNRNGVSIIDGDQVAIEESNFLRVSKKGMPGSIDVEPDDNFSIARNLKFISNTFERCDGGFAILYFTKHLSLKHNPSEIHFINNLITESCSPRGAAIAVVTGQKLEDSVAMNIVVEKNTILSKAPTLPMLLSNVQGVSIRENLFKNGSVISLGSFQGRATEVANLIFENNIVSHTGNSEGVLSITNGRNISFVNNIFMEPNLKSRYFMAFNSDLIGKTGSKEIIVNNLFIRGSSKDIQIDNRNSSL